MLFTERDTQKQIEVQVTPFFVSCNPVGDCGKSGTRTITVNVANPAASSNNGSQHSYASFKDEVWHFVAVPQVGTYDGYHYDLYGNCHGTERLIQSGFSVNSGALTVINNVFVSDGATGLVVKDNNGNTLYNIAVSECNYQIACDGNCPEGTCECHSDSYPGYCCNDCASTSAKLKAIGDELRSKQ
ncbi:hypothetical protein [Nostoc sp. 'Peltigera membranacea cyanobiont' 232]|uniref:hypothetical protein n=1 Tax=Nostoc sp. 'Peltigera membranacea cyanobiont' 232 TaxID=2014531 RepID=UPI00167C0965|nr:hypothetical protein [Nostoc sp. 'Peltigera membranacea cyanobiont' 232]